MLPESSLLCFHPTWPWCGVDMQVVLDDISTNQEITKKTWWAYMLSWNFLPFLSFSILSSLLPSLTTPPCSAAPKHLPNCPQCCGIWPQHRSPGRLLTHMDSRKGMFALNVCLLDAWNQQSQAVFDKKKCLLPTSSTLISFKPRCLSTSAQQVVTCCGCWCISQVHPRSLTFVRRVW